MLSSVASSAVEDSECKNHACLQNNMVVGKEGRRRNRMAGRKGGGGGVHKLPC